MFRALLSAIARRVTGNADGASAPTSQYAQEPDHPRVIALPWEGTADEVAANMATGSLRDSLKHWLTIDGRVTPRRCSSRSA